MVNKTIGNYLGSDLLTDFRLVVAVSVTINSRPTVTFYHYHPTFCSYFACFMVALLFPAQLHTS